MSISGIGGVGGGIPRIQPAAQTTGTEAGSGIGTGTEIGGSQGAGGFADALGAGVDGLQATQTKADDLAIKAATGSLTDAHDYMIASTEAGLATQLTTAVRNKAIEAFQEIMRMQG